MIFLFTLIMLCSGHALCDYPLQGDFLARGKNHKAPFPGMASWQILMAHSLIHAGMVVVVVSLSRLIAGRPLDHAFQLGTLLGLMELGIHAFTDWSKCDERIDFNQDQLIHYGCKLMWALIACA